MVSLVSACASLHYAWQCLFYRFTKDHWDPIFLHLLENSVLLTLTWIKLYVSFYYCIWALSSHLLSFTVFFFSWLPLWCSKKCCLPFVSERANSALQMEECWAEVQFPQPYLHVSNIVGLLSNIYYLILQQKYQDREGFLAVWVPQNKTKTNKQTQTSKTKQTNKDTSPPQINNKKSTAKHCLNYIFGHFFKMGKKISYFLRKHCRLLMYFNRIYLI